MTKTEPNPYAALAMSDAEVFATLCALPPHFRFEVTRSLAHEPDPFLTNAAPLPPDVDPLTVKNIMEQHERVILASIRPRTRWQIMLTMNDHGFSLIGHGPTMADAWVAVRRQLTSFTEVLG